MRAGRAATPRPVPCIRAVLVGLEENLVELLADRLRAAPGDQLAGPGVDLLQGLALALDAEQCGLDDLLGGLLEVALAEPPEVMRRIEQAEQHGRVRLDADAVAEVVARELGEPELALRREFPREVEIHLLREALRLRDEDDGLGLLELQQHVGCLHLGALAGVELDLQRAVGLAHHAAGVELSAFFVEGVHRGGLSLEAVRWRSQKLFSAAGGQAGGALRAAGCPAGLIARGSCPSDELYAGATLLTRDPA